MKRSSKIVIGIGIGFFALFIPAVLVLKHEAREVVTRYQQVSGYQRHEVGQFSHLSFGPGWEVNISSLIGESVSIKHGEGYTPRVTMRADTLYFELDTVVALKEPVMVNIRLKKLKSIAATGTNVTIESLETDSLSVMLDSQQSLKMIDCKIQNFDMQTEGPVTLQSIITQ